MTIKLEIRIGDDFPRFTSLDISDSELRQYSRDDRLLLIDQKVQEHVQSLIHYNWKIDHA